jgi:predicted kinase
MQIIIVSGTTSTGKTSIARKISSEFKLKILSKDEIKETLFVSNKKPPSLKSWKYYESESLRLFYEKLKLCIKNHQSVVIESNFHRQDISLLNSVLNGLEIKEVYCRARGLAVITRYIKRNERGERNPAHLDKLWYLLVIVTNIFSPLARRWNPPMSKDKKTNSRY